MAMGRSAAERQEELFIAHDRLPKSVGHVFYQQLNKLLLEADFDQWVEALCEPHYAKGKGRRSIPPGVYFRMLLVGYFEGLGSQRGIAWRCSDSLSLRAFLGVSLTQETPDHSSLSYIRNRLPLSVHGQVFVKVLAIAQEKKLLKGKTVAVDSTTLEANAAMKSIVRRDTNEDWNEYLTRLMQEEGLVAAGEQPSAEELRRFDKSRKNKSVSNDEWESPTDPDSRISRMKDGTTHLAYKAEHVIDMDSGMLLAAENLSRDGGRHGDPGRERGGSANESGGSGKRAGNQGGHRGQGLSCCRNADQLCRAVEYPHVYSRAAAEGQIEMEAQAARATICRVSQSPPHPLPPRTKAPAVAERAGRTIVCARLRNGRRAADVARRD